MIVFFGIIALSLMAACHSVNANESDINANEPDINAEASELTREPLTVSYCNPIRTADNGWEDYGFGDPFVLRFNGRYYLYPSTRDDEIGIKCWSSRDLVHWKYEGLCSTEPLTRGAYAPEVIHWNDSFYLVTSPAGQGHYILKSNAPTGPFVPISENLGLSIDGSIFIDDDGSWYFYHASEQGILGHRMTGPATIDPSPIQVGASMQGWTEGAMVVKQDGTYYITYTGNHVISRGYRIDAGTGASPLDFVPIRNNPILLKTQGPLYGIGHSSTVKGPNLDTYYIVYHSLVGQGKNGWPIREMNLDRLLFQRDHLSVVGPTRTPQPIPLADLAIWFDSPEELEQLRLISFFDSVSDFSLDAASLSSSDAATALAQNVLLIDEGLLRLEPHQAVVTCRRLEGDFTAEFHVACSSNEAEAGGLFCYLDPDHYGTFSVSGDSGQMTITFVVDGHVQTRKVELPHSFGEKISFLTLQSIQVERTENEFSFYVNDRLVAKDSSPLPSGSFGYYADASDVRFGYLGGTSATQGRSASQLSQPVPGTLYFCGQKTQNGAFSVDQDNAVPRNFDARSLFSGERLSADLNVADAGDYDVTVRYAAAADAVIRLTLDGRPVGNPFKLTPTELWEHFVTTIQRRIPFDAGQHRLDVVCEKGEILLSEISLVRHDDFRESGRNFGAFIDDFAYSDGPWKTEDGELVLDGPSFFGKRLYGQEGWGDYQVDADITFLDQSLNAGLLIRTVNPSLGGPNNSPALGTDFFQGYFIGFDSNSLKLSKHNYRWTLLSEVPLLFSPKNRIHMRVVAKGPRITVWIDGKKSLEYIDPSPFFWGRVGMRACSASVKFENFCVTGITDSSF